MPPFERLQDAREGRREEGVELLREVLDSASQSSASCEGKQGSVPPLRSALEAEMAR